MIEVTIAEKVPLGIIRLSSLLATKQVNRFGWCTSQVSSVFIYLFFLIICCFVCVDNILDDKPEGKSSADKEEQPVDEIPKRMKKTDSATQSKGKVENYSIKLA